MLEILENHEYVVLDLETTWLCPYREWITEIAAIKCNKDWEVIEEYQTLINPERHIPTGITRLTGISNEMDSKKEDKISSDVVPAGGNSKWEF